MKTTVIIPTRNRPGLLRERSLPSALNQTFKDFEVIIIDDASDVMINLFIPNDERATVYTNLERKGLAWNRNAGIDKAEGEYIVSLDDDNKFHPDFLTETVKFLDNHPEYDAVGVRKTIIYPEGRASHFPKLPCSINDGFLIRKEVFEEIKFDEDLHANEDADFGIRFFKEGFKMGLIDKTLMTVWASPIFNTTSYSDYTDYHLDGLAKFWLKHHDYKKYIGRMFLLASGHKWFRYIYWLEQKIKRYYWIWSSRKHR